MHPSLTPEFVEIFGVFAMNGSIGQLDFSIITKTFISIELSMEVTILNFYGMRRLKDVSLYSKINKNCFIKIKSCEIFLFHYVVEAIFNFFAVCPSVRCKEPLNLLQIDLSG